MMELPKPDSVFNEEFNANARSLYRSVYDAQSHANDKEELVCTRFVGYLLLHPISLTARGTILKELASIRNLHNKQVFPKIFELGKMYMDHLIRPFRKHNGNTPTSSSHTSRPSFDKRREDVKTILKENSTSQATAKKKALIRDGYRCMISGGFDRSSLSNCLDVEDAVHSSWSMDEIRLVSTECAYIFADSTNPGITGSSEAQLQRAILEGFGYPNLQARAIHRLDNVMTLHHDLYDLFEKLGLWLEAIDGTPNTYMVKTSLRPRTAATMRLPARVIFSHESALRTDPGLSVESELSADLPLPNPEYLHIHACVCKVAHMSGAADYIDYIFRKMEDISVLAEDGTSADVLAPDLLFI